MLLSKILMRKSSSVAALFCDHLLRDARMVALAIFMMMAPTTTMPTNII